MYKGRCAFLPDQSRLSAVGQQFLPAESSRRWGYRCIPLHQALPPLKIFCVAVRQQAERVRLSLYHMGFRDLTQVLRLGTQAPYLLSHLAGGFIRGQNLAISHDGLKPRNLVHSVMV